MQIQTQCNIPAIGVASSNIVHYATGYVAKYQTGMPVRYVSVPFPFTGQPKAVDVGYVTGKDMLTGQPFMSAVTKALTDPLTAEEKISGPAPEQETESRLLTPDSEENLRQARETGKVDVIRGSVENFELASVAAVS